MTWDEHEINVGQSSTVPHLSRQILTMISHNNEIYDQSFVVLNFLSKLVIITHILYMGFVVFLVEAFRCKGTRTHTHPHPCSYIFRCSVKCSDGLSSSKMY